MKRHPIRNGALLALCGVASVTFASHITEAALASFALLMLGVAGTIGGLTLMSPEAHS